MSSIFTQIMAGDIPGHFVHQDSECVVIMTIQPMNPGHVLVIPRAEIDHWDDLPEHLASHLMLVSRRMAKAIKQAFPSKRVGLLIAGLDVPHVHLHVFPVNEIADFDLNGLPFAEADALAQTAQQLRDSLASEK